MRRLDDWMQKGTNAETMDLAYAFLRKPFDSCCLVRDGEEYKRELDLEVRQRINNYGFLDRLHKLEFFTVPFATRLLLYALVSAFRDETAYFRLLQVYSSPCLAYYSGVLFCDDDLNTQRVHLMVALELVVLTSGAFLQTVCHGTTTQYHGCRI